MITGLNNTSARFLWRSVERFELTQTEKETTRRFEKCWRN